MKSENALRVLAEVTASQWGMVTSAQASTNGVTRLDLSRLTAAGHLKRLTHGVYMAAGAPSNQFDDLRAAWLSTEPTIMGEARIKNCANGIVVAGTSAAQLHDIGDLWADRHEFVSPKRRQSQRDEIRYRRRNLDRADVTLVDGLPTMTMERTITDLVEDVGDLSLVADALRDASFKRSLDLARLRELLGPMAERHGFKRGDGSALLSQLQEIAGIDPATVARRLAADTSLGSRVAANYFGNLSKEDFDRLMMTPEIQKAMRSIQDSVAATLQNALSPRVTALRPTLQSLQDNPVKSDAINALGKEVSDQITTSETMQRLSQAWGKSLSGSMALKPETSATFEKPRG